MPNRRKQYSSREKIELLRLHLVERKPVPAICEENGIHPTVLYRWQRQLFIRGHVLFLRRSPSRQAANYRRKVKELKVLARHQDRELHRLKRQLRHTDPPHLCSAHSKPAPVAYSSDPMISS